MMWSMIRGIEKLHNPRRDELRSEAIQGGIWLETSVKGDLYYLVRGGMAVVFRMMILILVVLAAMAVVAIVVEAKEYEHHGLSWRRFTDMVLWLLFMAALVMLVVWYFYDPNAAVSAFPQTPMQ